MQHRVGARCHALDPDLAIGGVKPRHDLGRAVADVLVRVAIGMPLGPPRGTGLWHGLERTGLVGTPDRQPHRLALLVGVLDQLSFAAVSGSVTTARPSLRLRSTVPVGHHERVFCGEAPAS